MQKTTADAPVYFLTGLFFVSGFASLIYQVAWQRVLFASFGSDLESVAIVVAAFMMGLGLGALGGGVAADKYPDRTLLLFCSCEAGIALYGSFSVPFMRTAGEWFVSSSLPTIAAVNFLLVLVPALLMGATLPILVAHTARRWGNVGKATGHLYMANTLGAALGALSTAFLLFFHMGTSQTVLLAASLNFGVAVLAALRLRVVR